MNKIIITICAFLLFSVNAINTANSAEIDKKEFTKLLEQVLREKPEIIFNILTENSEMVLDIAQQGSNQRRAKAMDTQWKRDLDKEKKVKLENRVVFGKADAPVSVIVFSDFSCPYCKQLAETLKDYKSIGDERVKMIFKHFPLEGHKFSRLAAEYHVAASLSQPEKAWAFHDKLFDYSERINNEGEAIIRKAAEDAGLDLKKLTTTMRSESKKIKSIIEEDLDDARVIGLSGTPNILVNNLVIRGAANKHMLKRAIDLASSHKK